MIKELSLLKAVSASTFRVSRLPVTALTSIRTVAPSQAAMSRERPSSYETPTTGNGGEVTQLTRKNIRPSVSALIHDHDTGCASGPSVLDFGLECAGPATDQRHRAAFEFIEVGGFAAAGRREWRSLGKPDTHRMQSRCYIA